MRILLIGATGFIGKPLVRNLRVAGHDLALFHRHAGAPVPGMVAIQGDRNHLGDCRRDLQQFAPDVVIDLILSSGKQAQDLMEVVDGITSRVVAISSMDVYRAWGVMHGVEPGGLEPMPLTEQSAVRSVRQLYPPEMLKAMQGVFSWLDENYDKIAVEEAVMKHPRVAGTVVRLPMVYGPGDPLHRFFPLLKRITDQRPAVLFAGDFAAWSGPRGYVDNVAHAIALAASSGVAAGRTYNVCQEPCLPEIDWQKSIAKQTDWAGSFVVLPRERTPRHLLLPGNAAQHAVASSARIRRELGYQEPVAIDDAIRRTIAWEWQNPPSTINPQQFDYGAEDSALADAA